MADTELIVVSIDSKHPSGQRCRAGFRFHPEPSVAEVTAEQRTIIKSDSYITIHRRLSLSWFSAFGVERTQVNEEKYAKKDPSDWKKTARIAERMEEGASGATEEAQNEPEGTVGAQEGKEINDFSTKEQVIKALEEKGLKTGTDFDPEATRNALLAIYRSK